VLSPLLANVYVHEVLDTWFETVVQAHCRGEVVLYRYADDVMIGCEREADARRIIEVLPKRFAKYGLEINTEKTKVVRFGRPPRSSADRQPGTFSFLGFVHYWGKTWRGSYTIKRKTEGKRLRRTLGEFWRWCRDNRHRAPQEQYVLLCAKLRGYYQYYGVRCNSQCLDLVYYAATRAWRYWLNRRGGRKMTWRAFGRMMAAYPLPRPKIVKGWVECRVGPRERRNWDELCWSADGDRCRGLPAMSGNLAVWKRAVPRNRMREIFTYGSVGGLVE
jgi:hypothetical protein